jgi:2-keto-4-pentenoate hydratase/2-oxohepta-3-ene-1,7-dioic acid hydratase in catechol pathway
MKLVNFALEGEQCLGVVKGDLVVNLPVAFDLVVERVVTFKAGSARSNARHIVLQSGPMPQDMIQLVQRDETWLMALDEMLSGVVDFFHGDRGPEGLLTPVEKARLRAPIPRPGKIVCVGRNYAEHARERGAELPAQPIFFLKSNNTICGPGDPIVLPPGSTQVDYEAEFAVVIGKGGKNIPQEEAYEHVAGYMILNDVSARDMQSQDKQWFRGKSCDTFAPTGPWIVTRDELPDPHSLRISLTLNDRTMQDSNTSNLIFKVPFLVSYLSQTLTWEPGDILSTGTPEGVGAHQTPPVFLKAGDTVSIAVEKIGTLTNPVAEPQ